MTSRDELEEAWESLLSAWSDFRFVLRKRTFQSEDYFARQLLTGVERLLMDNTGLKFFVEDKIRNELDRRTST